MANYIKILGAKRMNEIIAGFNDGKSGEELGLKDAEKEFYESIKKDAMEVEKRLGHRPQLAYVEIDFDDPSLDIYRD